jgi:hypothetical protein
MEYLRIEDAFDVKGEKEPALGMPARLSVTQQSQARSLHVERLENLKMRTWY